MLVRGLKVHNVNFMSLFFSVPITNKASRVAGKSFYKFLPLGGANAFSCPCRDF